MKLLRRTAFIAAAALALAPPAFAQKSADTLRILFVKTRCPTSTCTSTASAPGLILAHQAWDMLVHRDPATFEIKPALATDWRFAEDNSLDLTIRQGVKFHDGSTLSADDVVYTINMAANPESKVATPSNYAWIDKAEKTGDWTVRIKMKKPTPAALEYLAMVTPIHPKAYREKVGPEGFAAKPVGAGPYKIVKNEQGKEVVFERFDDYWAGSPKGKPAIKTLHVRFVPDLTTDGDRASGPARRLDLEHQPRPGSTTSTRCRTCRRCSRNRCASATCRSMPPAARRRATRSPTRRCARRSGTPSTARTWPTSWCRAAAACRWRRASRRQFGCDADAAVKYPYDPAKAKALLAEAGFPNGFDIELVTYVQPTIVDGGDPELPAGGRHPRQDHPAAGRGRHPEGVEGREPALPRQLGQLLDQRRLGDLPGDVWRRQRRLCARSRAREAGRRRRRQLRSGGRARRPTRPPSS